MRRLYNIDTSPVVVNGWADLAIPSGEGRDFDDETATYLLGTGRWSEKDPRAGLGPERAFKARRSKQASPAQPDEKGSS